MRVRGLPALSSPYQPNRRKAEAPAARTTRASLLRLLRRMKPSPNEKVDARTEQRIQAALRRLRRDPAARAWGGLRFEAELEVAATEPAAADEEDQWKLPCAES